MSLIYESEAFSEELKKRVNADVEYREKAKKMNWKMLIVVDDVPFATYSLYSSGELVERKHLRSSEIEGMKKMTDFIVDIPTFELSVEMATGKKSMESLFFGKQIKVDGSLFKALQYRDALEKVVKITAQLASESIIPSKDEFVKVLHARGLL